MKTVWEHTKNPSPHLNIIPKIKGEVQNALSLFCLLSPPPRRGDPAWSPVTPLNSISLWLINISHNRVGALPMWSPEMPSLCKGRGTAEGGGRVVISLLYSVGRDKAFSLRRRCHRRWWEGLFERFDSINKPFSHRSVTAPLTKGSLR